MDIQDHGKNHSSVNESQVHVCHKCGWPFPNPHPSAKHRRSHKKICGTIEGYKLTDSTASDEEPLSAECPQTPFVQVMESCNAGKTIGGIGAISNRSEDEVFSDAAMEFQDGGLGFGRQDSLDHATKSDKDLTATISFKDCEDTSDVIPIETEPLMDVLEESRKVNVGDEVAECSVRQKNDGDGNEVDNLNRNISGGFVLPDEHHGEISETASKSENAEQEGAGKGNPDDITSETQLADKIVEVKENGDKLALNTVINDLSGQAESGKDIDASTCTFQIPTDVIQLDKESDTLGKTFIMLPDATQVVTVSDTYLRTEKENDSVYALSVPEDIPAAENAKIELEGFKEHSTVKLPRLEAVASEEIIVDKEKSVEDIVKDELVEGKANVVQLDKGSDDTLGSFVGVDANENEKRLEVRTLEEKQPVYVSDDLQKMGFSGPVINVLPNADPTVSHSEDMHVPELTRTGVFDIAEDENTRRTEKEYHVKNSLTSNESMNDSSLFQTNPASNKLEVENSTFEPVNPHQQSPVVTKEGNNECTRVIETKDPDSNRVSNSLDDIEESEISRDNKVQWECSGEDLRTSASDGNEFEETLGDRLKNESLYSPSYPEPTGQNSGAVDDSHTGESRVDTSGFDTVSLQGGGDNRSIHPQLDTAKVDVSNSSSQSHSMDGQWGFVSDNLAVIDPENSPSTGSHPFSEPEKAKASEQHSHKSDEFEPPSFSTLVEPGGSDQAGTIAQNARNLGAVPSQAGWFPSLTHAANESQGRKKNEEMIEKVANWNTKQHIPLKSLLGDASNEAKPMPPVEPPRDEKVVVAKDNGGVVTKVSSLLGPESPEGEAANVESGKEWNSPARFQAHISGREKRKVKGRPLWAQFVCCSSIN